MNSGTIAGNEANYKPWNNRCSDIDCGSNRSQKTMPIAFGVFIATPHCSPEARIRRNFLTQLSSGFGVGGSGGRRRGGNEPARDSHDRSPTVHLPKYLDNRP
jgi:hypothetical protein